MEVAPLPQLTASDRWRLAARRAGTHSLAIWPPLVLAWMVVVSVHAHALAFDFSHAYLHAAHAILAGRSPYPPATTAAVGPRDAFVYPPLTGFLAVPFTALPAAAADALMTAISVALVVGTLRLLDVRDWRCYAVTFLWVPTYCAIQTANVTLLLAFGIALIWRHRHRTALVSVAAGFLIALKLFFWPFLLWLVLARRYRAAAGGAAAAAFFVFAPWAAIGFAGFTGYPHLMSLLTQLQRSDAYTIAALLSGVISWNVAYAVAVVLGAAALARSSRLRTQDERASFAMMIAAILLLSPIVEMHYFVFLAVVLGLFRPRFGWTWTIPLLLWVGPQGGNGATWQTGAVLAAVASAFLLVLRDGARVHARAVVNVHV